MHHSAVQPRRMARTGALLLVPMLGIGIVNPVSAQDAQNATALSGSIRGDYFSSTRKLDDEHDVFALHAELKLTHALGEGQHLEIEGRVSANDIGDQNDARGRLLAAYWSGGTDQADWRIGQQRIRWGKADGINPTDFFTPLDYNVLLPLETDRYQSIPAARVDVHLDDVNSLSFVFERGFTPTRLPPTRAPVALDIDDIEPTGFQYGVRLLHAGEDVDWSVSGFHGFSTVPVLSFNGLAPGGSLIYERYYPSSEGLGFDIARSIGKWGFRAEVAYTNLETGGGRQSVFDNVFMVAGVDRSIDTWNINVQALWRYAIDYQKPNSFLTAGEELAATQNAIVYNQQEQLTRGYTLRIGTSAMHETLRMELQGVIFLEPANYFLRPLVTYAFSDDTTIRVGGEYYSGPEQSYFGALDANRTVFAEIQRFF